MAPRSSMMWTMLLGRGRELRRLSGLVAAAIGGRAGALLLVGEAGIGKTVLLDGVRSRARKRGMRLLELRCVESEAVIEGGGLADMVGALRDRLAALVASQRRPLDALLGLAAAPVAADRYAAAAALLALLAEEATHGPLLVLVDDAHWLDELSALALAFVARRLDAEPIAVVAALRSGHDNPLTAAGLPSLELGGLPVEDCVRLLDGEVAPDVARALAHATGGNPLWLREVARGLDDDARAGLAPLEVPAPLPALDRALHGRLDGLDAVTRAAAVVVAAGAGDDADEVRAAVDDAAGIDALEAAGLVALDGRRLAFAHPVLRAAAYYAAPPAQRRAAHAALSAAAGDPLRRAWHLAAAAPGPDAVAAAALEEVAATARAQLGAGGAAAALDRAVALTPVHDDADRRRRLAQAALEHEACGRQEHALALLEQAVGDGLAPVERARLQMVRANSLYWLGRSTEALALLDSEIARLDGETAEVGFELRFFAAIGAMPAGRPEEAERRAAALAADTAQAPQGLVAAVLLDQIQLLRGHPPPRAQAAARRAQLWEVAQGSLPPQLFLQLLAGDMWEDDLELSLERVDASEAAMREQGALAGVPYALTVRSELQFRLGRLPAARADALAALDLQEATGQRGTRLMSLTALARVDAVQGPERASRAHLREVAAAHAGPSLDRSAQMFAAQVGGLLELTLGRVDAAIEQLSVARERAAAHGVAHPGVVAWQTDLAEALARAGRRDEALAQLEELDERAARCDSRSATAAAARVRGLLADDDGFDACFADALASHATVPAPFERARTLLCHGERLRRARRRAEARGPLREALDEFERLGAVPWAARARAELAATGERRSLRRAPDDDTLTPQELRVATALAAGASVREAAAALFLSPKTVEAHLARAYRKLGASTRAELRARLGASS